MGVLNGWLSLLTGLVLFGGAYYIHQRVRLTRFACVLALLAGFIVYNGQLGGIVNRYAAQAAVLLFVGVTIGIAVIVADIKGKKKGADRPALFAFFLVPIFLVAFLSTLPSILGQASSGVEKVGNNVQQMSR